MGNHTKTYRAIPYLDKATEARVFTANRVRQEPQEIIAQRDTFAEEHARFATGPLMSLYPFRKFEVDPKIRTIKC